MKNKFMLGAVSGIAALTAAVPLLAQVTNAQTPADTPSAPDPSLTAQAKAPLTVEQIQQMITHDDAFLANIDAAVTVQKAATQAHRDALASAATITDDTTRQEAVRKANEAYRTAIQDAIAAHPDLKEALRFGPMGGHGFGEHGRRGRHGPEDLAQKLGMTVDELKSELDSGKTIEEIAQEKGVDLPAPPAGMHGMMPPTDPQDGSDAR